MQSIKVFYNIIDLQEWQEKNKYRINIISIVPFHDTIVVLYESCKISLC